MTVVQTGTGALPAAFRLVAACCIWPPSDRRNTAIQNAVTSTMDWDAVLDIVQRQRVAGLVNDGLRHAAIAPPPDVQARLIAGAAGVARQALQLASEAVGLQAAFDAASLPACFVKGTALALLAYQNIGIKHAWDIDLLVTPQDVRRACDVLKAAGFARTLPPPSLPDERFFTWTEFARECVFHNQVRGTYLELHWRLSDNPAQLAHVTAASATRLVPVSQGLALRTLNDEDLFAYLCLHGAHHGWSRMKWLADLCAWTSAKPPQEIERLYRRAKADGVGRAAAQAFLLCERLFGMTLPPGLSAEMTSDRATRWLVSVALDAMAGDTRQTGDRALGNLKIQVSHFLLASGLRHWLQELNSKSIGWTDFQHLALPRPLFFLYPILRVPSWIWRRISHLMGLSRQTTS